MGLAEDLKALQELCDKGELSESAYTAAARDAFIGKQAQPVTTANAKPLIGRLTKIFLVVVILLVGLGIFISIYENASKASRTEFVGPGTAVHRRCSVRTSNTFALQDDTDNGRRSI